MTIQLLTSPNVYFCTNLEKQIKQKNMCWKINSVSLTHSPSMLTNTTEHHFTHL